MGRLNQKQPQTSFTTNSFCELAGANNVEHTLEFAFFYTRYTSLLDSGRLDSKFIWYHSCFKCSFTVVTKDCHPFDPDIFLALQVLRDFLLILLPPSEETEDVKMSVSATNEHAHAWVGVPSGIVMEGFGLYAETKTTYSKHMSDSTNRYIPCSSDQDTQYTQMRSGDLHDDFQSIHALSGNPTNFWLWASKNSITMNTPATGSRQPREISLAEVRARASARARARVRNPDRGSYRDQSPDRNH